MKVSVKLREGTGEQHKRELESITGNEVIYASRIAPLAIIEIPREKVRLLQNVRIVETVDDAVKKVKLFNTDTSLLEAYTMKDAEVFMKLDYIKDKGYTGKGTKVGVIDSGIDIDHPAFKRKTVNYVDFTKTDKLDEVGHGTWVAHAVGGREFTFQGSTVPEGMSPDCDLVVAKCFTTEDADIETPMQGMEWAVLQGAKILNCSWGGFETYEPIRILLDTIRSRGVVVVCAAGNSGPVYSSMAYPAGYREALAVGSISMKDGSVARWSSRGPSVDGVKPDIVAPGGAGEYETIVGAFPDGIANMQGTSMAAPMVSGGLACLYGARPFAADALVEQAYELSKIKNNDIGYGVTDFQRALVEDIGQLQVDQVQVSSIPAIITALLFILGIGLVMVL